MTHIFDPSCNVLLQFGNPSRGIIEMLEKVQRNAIRMIPKLSEINYRVWREALNLSTLVERMINADDSLENLES